MVERIVRTKHFYECELCGNKARIFVKIGDKRGSVYACRKCFTDKWS